jgi:hypothetical protein
MVDSMKSAPVALLETLSGVDVFAADAPACNRWLGDLKRVQGWVDAFRAQVTARLDALAADGESFGSEATHSRCSGMTARDAAKERERARTLGAADGFADALSEGTVTGAHVDQLAQATANLADEIRAGVFDRSGDLLEQAAATDPGRFGRHVRDLARRLERDAGVSRDAQQRATSYLNITVAGDGMYDVHGRLHPELGARVKRALDHHVAAMIKKGEQAGVAEFVDRTVNRGRLAGEALGELVSTGHGTLRPIVADIGVLVDERTLATGEMHDHSACETTDGAPLPMATVRRLICDAFVTGIVISQDGTPLNVGRTRRTANRAQRRALRCLYRTCVAEGCDVPYDQCELHHIWWWETGGPSDLDNFVPACAHHHHHLIHSLAWQLHLAPDRTLTITDRHGITIMVTTPDMPHPTRSRHRRTQPAPAGEPERSVHPESPEQQPALFASGTAAPAGASTPIIDNRRAHRGHRGTGLRGLPARRRSLAAVSDQPSFFSSSTSSFTGRYVRPAIARWA